MLYSWYLVTILGLQIERLTEAKTEGDGWMVGIEIRTI
jgi:hypothetical protein